MLPFCDCLEGSTAKNWLYEGSSQGIQSPRKGQQSFRSNPNGVGDLHYHVETAVDWCGYAYLAVTAGEHAGDAGSAG